MRTAKTVIAITGDAASGKTAVARQLSERLKRPARHCGDEVRALANSSGVDVNRLPDHVHVGVDEETRAWAAAMVGVAVVEGTFLRHVLAGAENVILVALTCDAASHRARFESASKGGVLPDRLASDEALMRRLYAASTARVPDLTIDTSGMSVDSVVDTIIDFVRP